jgi:hypothetical protein
MLLQEDSYTLIFEHMMFHQKEKRERERERESENKKKNMQVSE